MDSPLPNTVEPGENCNHFTCSANEFDTTIAPILSSDKQLWPIFNNTPTSSGKWQTCCVSDTVLPNTSASSLPMTVLRRLDCVLEALSQIGVKT